MDTKMKKKLITIGVLAAIVTALIVVVLFVTNSLSEKTDINTYLNELHNQSDLVTQKLDTSGVLDRKTKGIPFITKDSYLVKYRATVYASTDVDKIDIKSNSKGVIVTIPHAKVHSVNIPPESIEYYDKGVVLLRSTKDETIKVQKAIKKQVLKEANKVKLLEKADKNAEDIVRKTIAKVNDKEKIEIVFK